MHSSCIFTLTCHTVWSASVDKRNRGLIGNFPETLFLCQLIVMRLTYINQIAINLREFLEMKKFHAVCNGLVGGSLILASSCSNKSNVQIGLYLTEMNFCFTRTPTSYLPPHFTFSAVKIKYRCLWHAIKFVTVSDNLILISLAELKRLTHITVHHKCK